MAVNLFKNHPDLEFYLNLLDWNDIVIQLQSLSHFELTTEKITRGIYSKPMLQIESELNFLSEYLNCYDDFQPLFNSSIPLLNSKREFLELVKSIPKEPIYSIEHLSFFLLTVEAYIKLQPAFNNTLFFQNYSLSTDQLSKLKQKFLKPTREFIDPSGAACFDRHPELRKIHEDIRSIEESLRNSVQKIIKSEFISLRLQQETYDIINDRFVIPVRSDSYKSEIGTIVARSQSGQTLYVEPFELRELSNLRLQKLAEIEAIILKLCIEASRAIHQLYNEFQILFSFTLDVDWLNTRAQFVLKHNLTRPILNNTFSYEFIGLYHPLISNPIKNDFVLSSEKKGIIISGPNTGGKTVFLKAATLSLIFVQIGLFVPATYAQIDPVGNLFYFSHDHQNLKEGLSSFASEAKYYLELISHLGNKNFIIIDEVFNSTSSEEASALAIAFLEELENHQDLPSKVIISTHHQVLKTFMHSKSHYISAHVGYDFENNKPTYKLLIGEPGSSLAFKVFETLSQKLNINTQIADRAKDFLDHKQLTYESLLQDLTAKKIELTKTLEENRQLQIELKNQKASFDGILFLEKEKELANFKNKLSSIIKDAESTYEEVKSQKMTSTKSLNQKLSVLQAALNKEAQGLWADQKPINSQLKEIDFSEIKIGNIYFSIILNKNCKVLNINPRKLEVQISQGAVSSWAHFSTLRMPHKNVEHKTAHHTPPHISRKSLAQIEIDCRGMRLEDFQKTCEEAIYDLISGEIPFLTIIHGHGNGVLKNWLRTYLKKFHSDLEWENIEGNDGCTKINFKPN